MVHTTYDTDEEIYQAVKSGAKAYLLKDAPTAELLQVIRKVHAARCAYHRIRSEARVAHERRCVTAREIQVLTLLAQGRSNKEIAAIYYLGNDR
jgi:two-component system NarL family response regulator